VLTAQNVDDLRVRIVCGAANDTLDTPEVAALLAARGITYVPDFIANGGGVIQVHAGEVGWSEEEMMARLEGIGDLVAKVLADADAHGRTPVESALQIAQERLSAGRAVRDDR
jgi:leucine dehydrogenase